MQNCFSGWQRDVKLQAAAKAGIPKLPEVGAASCSSHARNVCNDIIILHSLKSDSLVLPEILQAT